MQEKSMVTLIPEWENKFNVSLSDSFDLDLLELYKKFLWEKNEEGGFFSKKDGGSFLERHLLESMVFVKTLEERNFVSHETSLVDVGTGPGLPGFLFLCLKKSPSLCLLDSAKRKLGLLEDWWETKIKIQEPGIYDSKNILFQYGRVEESKGNFSVAVMRAAIPYPFSIEVICRIIKQNGYFFPFLGKEKNWSVKEREILSGTGFIIEDEIILDRLCFLGDRKIKVLKKKAVPKHGIPREWKQISKDIKDAEWVK